MDAFQIMSRMMQQEEKADDPNLYSLSVSLAEQLALISGRLDTAEINSFIDIAAAIYRRGLQEGREGELVKGSFPERQTWPDGYQQGPGSASTPIQGAVAGQGTVD